MQCSCALFVNKSSEKLKYNDRHCIEKHSNTVKKKKKEDPRKIFMKMPINVRFVAKVLSIVGT